MSVRIRMKKLGRTHRPFYRICVMDSRSPRNGKTIEEIGTYDPMVRNKSERVKVNMERADYWISVGAQPTEKVGVLLRKVRENVWGEVKQPPPMQAPKVKAEEPAAEETATEESAAASAEES